MDTKPANLPETVNREKRDVVTLAEQGTVILKGLSLTSLSQEQRQQFDRLVEIVDVVPTGLLIRRNRRHIVGRIALPSVIIVVPPPFPADLFVDFFLYAS